MDIDCIRIAYFSMEIGINNNMPTYSGGLGILAGDTLRSFADFGMPIVGITLLYKKGYFKQVIDSEGNQIEEDENWNPEAYLKKLPNTTTVKIHGRDVKISCWLHELEGIKGKKIPLLFLDTDLEENSEYDRKITSKLYGYDEWYRFAQEIVLGIGGVRILENIGFKIQKYHMNEGHSALLTLELLGKFSPDDAVKKVREKCIFTTHTPVPAGHDKFDKDIVFKMLGEYLNDKMQYEIFIEDKLNMTYLGLKFSKYVNGVAKKHGEISRGMFPGYGIESITNGVHAAFWTSKPFQEIYDKHIPLWQCDPFSLRYILGVDSNEIWKAHILAKKKLVDEVFKKTKVKFNPDKFILGYGRRFTGYKRPDMLFHDIEKLKRIADEVDEIQIIFSGKAHPKDNNGKEILRKVINTGKSLNEQNCKVKVVFLENYSINVAKLMVSGCDVWLNNPQRPHEASGTSGMKAAVNGVPHFSTLDGWWLEGHVENVTGWSIGLGPQDAGFSEDISVDDEALDFYKKLREMVLPTFYNDRAQWIKIMKNAIAINGSFFNTDRMVQQYVLDAYFL
jgi:glycogen phosphorylase